MIVQKNFDKLMIGKNGTVVEALKKLNEEGKKILFVAEKGKLLGVLTDGDIRRHILKTGKIKGRIEDFYNSNPIFVYEDQLGKEAIKRLFVSKKIEIIPVVKKDLVIVGYIEWADVLSEDCQSQISHERITEKIPVVIMAGGKGTRLKPFTDVLPKPLIPIGDKTIIEHVIDSFRAFGLARFILILNYKGRVVEAYLNSVEKDYNIDFIYEQEFLGTAGGLKLLEDIIEEDNFIVSNCDVVLKCDYKDALDFHLRNGSVFTSITSIQHFKIPYGVVNTKPGGVIETIEEKPEYTFQVNTGIYIVKKDVLNYIPKNVHFDMPSLISRLLEDKQMVLSYPVKGNDYMDIGQWSEYNKWMRRLDTW